MDPSLVVSAIAPGLEIVRTLIESATKSSKEKKTYQQKLEAAEGADVYKYVLLINVAALEGYVAQARLQAQQSFDLSKKIAVIGFGTIIVSICLSVFLTMRGIGNLNAAYLAAIAGVLTEFISGVFFFLYSKTLGQINLFHDKLVDMQKTALTHLSDVRPKTTSDNGTANIRPLPGVADGGPRPALSNDLKGTTTVCPLSGHESSVE